MASEPSKNIRYFEKLPNIVLIPWHFDNKTIHPYPYCGKREIYCGPKLQDKDSIERKLIRTSGTHFDITEVISQLKEEDKHIDLILSVLEAGNTCFPRNLSKIKCPKMALVADTHHLKHSISSIIAYLKQENFEHMFIFGQPAHLHFFYEASIKHCAFGPSTALKMETGTKKKSGITYIGKTWSSSHPRRSRMVQFLAKNLPKYNILFRYYNRLPKLEWFKVLSNSKMIAISSLNGQFTPQIYSCLCAGALCFVDELSPQTSLYRFFEPGKHLVTWRNFEDLLEKIIYYKKHPNEADAIAKAGKCQVVNEYATAESFALSIAEFVFENKIDPRLLAINDKRCQNTRVEAPEYFDARVRLYENIQELHRIHESLKLISFTKENLKPSADLADLPRLEITHAFSSDEAQNDANLFFQSVEVDNQIETVSYKKMHKTSTYDIGILETSTNQAEWKLIVRTISHLLKRSSLLWVFGKVNSFEKEILKKEGFKPYSLNQNSILLKIKNISRKVWIQFWKWGKYPFPYLTLKPAMDPVPYLDVFIRGWQAKMPFLF